MTAASLVLAPDWRAERARAAITGLVARGLMGWRKGHDLHPLPRPYPKPNFSKVPK